ncbi:MAG: hypothetical protein NTY11_01695 [Candidatus Parcubacteria bacterium]|nr:hypothetical protein [Candidatus Parcubacteria bacterium]
MDKKFIFSIIALLIIIGGILVWQLWPALQISKEEKACANMQSQENKDICYHGVAFAQKNLSICNKIQSQDGRGFCQSEIAKANQDPMDCDKVEENFQLSCYSYVAIMTQQDSSVCAEMSTQTSQDNCYYGFAAQLEQGSPVMEKLENLAQIRAKNAEIVFQLGQQLANEPKNIGNLSISNPSVKTISDAITQNGGQLIIQKSPSSAYDFCAYSKLNKEGDNPISWYCIEGNGAKCYPKIDPAASCNQKEYTCSCSF